MYDTADLKWDGLRLRLNSGRLLATVEPDAGYDGMWRVRLPDGYCTDMVNLPRAKDAALALAVNALNLSRQRHSPSEASPVRQKQSDVPKPAPRCVTHQREAARIMLPEPPLRRTRRCRTTVTSRR